MYPGIVLVPLIVKHIKDNKRNVKTVTAALEVLVVLLKEDHQFCGHNANVMEAVITVAENLEENS